MLKLAVFCGNLPVLGVEHFRDKLEAYLKYSNEDRIKLKLDGMSPVQYRVHHQAKAS